MKSESQVSAKYFACKRQEKKLVAKELAEWVLSNGGRFLQKAADSTGQWAEAPFEKVLIMCSQALRTRKKDRARSRSDGHHDCTSSGKNRFPTKCYSCQIHRRQPFREIF